jgi:hypothetical protein
MEKSWVSRPDQIAHTLKMGLPSLNGRRMMVSSSYRPSDYNSLAKMTLCRNTLTKILMLLSRWRLPSNISRRLSRNKKLLWKFNWLNRLHQRRKNSFKLHWPELMDRWMPPH